jgi:hypothetical protein
VRRDAALAAEFRTVLLPVGHSDKRRLEPLAINGAHSANIGLAYGALDPATPP